MPWTSVGTNGDLCWALDISRKESDTLYFSISYSIEELSEPVGWGTMVLQQAGHLGIRLVI
jgi:hypothetical protein